MITGLMFVRPSVSEQLTRTDRHTHRELRFIVYKSGVGYLQPSE